MLKFNLEKYNKVLLEPKQDKSIFNYYTDYSRHENKNRCVDFTPPFLSYIPSGVNEKMIHVESDLKGITRNNSNCTNEKYIPSDPNLITRLATTPLYNLNECSSDYKIIAKGYIH